jgi:hypothetical protein
MSGTRKPVFWLFEVKFGQRSSSALQMYAGDMRRFALKLQHFVEYIVALHMDV